MKQGGRHETFKIYDSRHLNVSDRGKIFAHTISGINGVVTCLDVSDVFCFFQRRIQGYYQSVRVVDGGKSVFQIQSMDRFVNGSVNSCRHPMMCDEKYPNDFLKSDCFLKTKDLVHWLGCA